MICLSPLLPQLGFEAAGGGFSAGYGAQGLVQGFAHVVDVGFGGGAGGGGLAVADGVVDGGVLFADAAAGGGDALEFVEVEPDVVVQQAQQGAEEVADEHVVRGVSHGLVEGDVGIGTGGVAGGGGFGRR